MNYLKKPERDILLGDPATLVTDVGQAERYGIKYRYQPVSKRDQLVWISNIRKALCIEDEE